MTHTSRFCVIAQARSGSEALTTRLNEHPEIACHRELFNRRTVYTALTGAFKARLPSIEERDAAPLAAIERVFALSEEAFADKRVFGFKLFLNHSPEVRKAVRADAQYRLLVLERGNKLAQFVSHLTARETGQWSAFAGAGKGDGKGKGAGKGKGKDQASEVDAPPPPPPPPVVVEVDVAELARFVELETQRYGQFNERIQGRADVMHLASEQIDARFAEVLDFLGVEIAPELRVVRLRQNPAALETRIRNWPDVYTWLLSQGHQDWASN